MWEGVEIADKTLGIIGLGRIGKLVAQRASAFGMRIVAHDPFIAADVARKLNIDLLSLDIEGGEPAALRGLDFHRHAPRFICVEARARAEIDALLTGRYAVAEVLAESAAYQDVLYQRR